MRILLVFFAGLASGSLVGLWIAGMAAAPAPAVQAARADPEVALSRVAIEPADADELQPSRRTPVTLESPPVAAPSAPAPPVISAEDAWRSMQDSVRNLPDLCDGTPESVAAKYAGMNPAQLKLAFIAVKARFDSETNRLLSELPFQEASTSSEGGARTSSGALTAAFKFEQALDGGRIVSRSATLDAETNPAYLRLNVEYTWLHSQLHTLGW